MLHQQYKSAFQQHVLQLRQDIAETSPYDKPNFQPVDKPQTFKDTSSSCASSRGVKLLISTTCETRRALKKADFIGANLQAKVIGCHFVNPSTPNSSACPFCSTKASMILSTPANAGTLTFWNGSTHNDLSNLLPNHPILSDTRNPINCSASYFFR
jgi:hypothetical protein